MLKIFLIFNVLVFFVLPQVASSQESTKKKLVPKPKEIQIIGFISKTLSLYDEANSLLKIKVKISKVKLPIKVIETSTTSRFKIKINGLTGWVNSYEVKTVVDDQLVPLIRCRAATAGGRGIGERGC